MKSMKELLEIVSDEALNEAFKNTNFGSEMPRDVLKDTLLKYACGWHSGSTATAICKELGLLNKRLDLTKTGKMYLWYAYSTN